MSTEDHVPPVVLAGRVVAVAVLRALVNDSQADWDELTRLLDETDAGTLRAALEELGLLFVAVARPSDDFLETFGLQAAVAVAAGETTS